MESVDGAVNIGSGVVYSIREIVDMLGAITGMADRVRWDPTKPNGQEYREYDLSRMRLAGFQCRHSIAEGLRETWDWYCREFDGQPAAGPAGAEGVSASL
jgi:GDP-L-fucose synthase